MAGSKEKKGKSGAAKNYITRTQAVRKLQISLPDFRRLCIFKGIYPREPRNKKKANKSATHSTTFYYTRDIQYLLHEPLLNKFRDHKALAKKISRALGRGEVGDASRLEKNLTPRMTLDHIIKERYPTFVDALRDLDDCLSMLFLFANLPSTAAVPAKTIALCKRLTLEFEHYLIVSHSLRKSFLSIKGIYYQATIQGQDILWLVPYKFVQRVTNDVDFRIMGTFVEFYTTLLGFVNFRLYNSVGLIYPPKFSKESDDQGGELGAFTLQGKGIGEQPAIEAAPAANGDAKVSEAAQAAADKVAKLAEPDAEMQDADEAAEADKPNDAIDKFEATGEDADELPQPQASSSEAAALFEKFTFYLSRETPREPLEFILKAFGCKRVGWDAVLGDGAFTTNESDPAITHQIVDRPNIPVPTLPESEQNGEANGAQRLKPGTRVPGRTYVQPQWVWDCANQGKLLRPDLYAPGATLPPHLSPWVKPKKGEYDPTKSLEEQEREGEAEEAEEEDESEAEAAAPKKKSVKESKLLDLPDEVEAGEGMDVAGSEDESDEEEDEEEEEDDEAAEELDSDVDEEQAARIQHQRELEAEAKGKPYAADADKKKKGDARKRKAKKDKAEEEELDRQKMMMSRSKRKLLEKMTYSNKKKDEQAEKLRSKRRRIEKGKA
ncbi:Ribosome biogenesis protein pescadillo [Lasiodiplodia theobromae]|uniref:Ribosome biogenesis protein pescadillo n=1 Tax=Lasiodiplodia theobromae TaxID=45133 RepID=UPI0015C3FC14|nr:Ribosome biogenesis protein pescadillo [Lasiodiplodia theobromae]KAF4540733.1 Ribosome biogenesis protein pescadillo [Lasiodiplodia theobromae]